MRIQIEVTNKELDELDNVIMAWNLCDKHKTDFNATEYQNWKFTQTCPMCIEINKKLRGKALHLWNKLVTAYLKAKKKKSKK